VSIEACAEVDLYASMRQGLVLERMESGSEVVFRDVNSRVGVRGNEQLVNGVTAFGRLEWGVQSVVEGSMPENRLAYAGLSGRFGALSFGTQWSAWDNYVGGRHMGLVSEGPWHSGSLRNGGVFKYAGSVRGFAVEADAQLRTPDGSTGATVEELQLASGRRWQGLELQAAYIVRDSDAGESGNTLGLRISYGTEKMDVSLAVASDTRSRGDEASLDGYKVRAQRRRGKNEFIAVLTFGERSGPTASPKGVAVGFQHNFSNRTRVALEMASVDPDIAGQDVTMEGGVLFRHDW